MTDWYIDQMKRPAYDSPALPISFERIDYQTGTNDDVAIRPQEKALLLQRNSREKVENSFELNNVLDYWIKQYHKIPTDTIWFKIDKDAVLRSGMKIPDQYIGATDEETKANMPDRMIISLKGKSRLFKNDIMMLDLIAHCNWERPLFVATTVGEGSYLNLDQYFLLEGLAYRITPFNWQELGSQLKTGDIDTDKMYDNLMSFNYGGLDDPDLYLDETIRRMCSSHRHLSLRLAIQFFNMGEKDKALAVMDKVDAGISDKLFPINDAIWGSALQTAELYYHLDRKDKAAEIFNATYLNYIQYMKWYLSMNDNNLLRHAKPFIDYAEIPTYIFPYMKEYMDEDEFMDKQEEWEMLCNEFDNRVR